MAAEILLEKKEKWAQLPIKEHRHDKAYTMTNAYTAILTKCSPVTVSSGIIFPHTEGRAALILGQPPTPENVSLEIKGGIVGCGELSCILINQGEGDISLNPFSKLARVVIIKTSQGDPIILDRLDETARGSKGFGSTGLL